MKTIILFQLLIFFLLLGTKNALAIPRYIADHTVATEAVLRNIPQKYIDKARTTLHIAYQHTSHGTHVSRGMYGLQDYKTEDNVLFAINRLLYGEGTPVENKLNVYDYAINVWPYNVDGGSSDLSANETAFIQLTRNYLDHPDNSHINVVMWAWCQIEGHDVAGNYLPGMQSLIDEYGPGGTKIGTGEGQREVAVTFIFMSGHANSWGNTGDLQPKPQADLINNYCTENEYFCLDYYSIDTHDMDGNYWEDAGDDGNSATGGNFYQTWQDSHVLGQDWFENKETPNGTVMYGAHNTQHITANRKGYAMWWILARIAGWDGTSGSDNNFALLSPAIQYLLLK